MKGNFHVRFRGGVGWQQPAPTRYTSELGVPGFIPWIVDRAVLLATC
jgi:hypothetical protein